MPDGHEERGNQPPQEIDEICTYIIITHILYLFFFLVDTENDGIKLLERMIMNHLQFLALDLPEAFGNFTGCCIPVALYRESRRLER